MRPRDAPKIRRAVEPGPAILRLPDVLLMFQSWFWRTDLLTALRYPALTALLGCCHILFGQAAGILLANWRPLDENRVRRDVVIVKRHGQWHPVPLTPTVIFLVERYIEERNRVAEKLGWTSDFLFVSRSGARLHKNVVDLKFKKLRKRIKARTTISRMLKNFCVRNLATGNDETASRRFRGISKPLGDRNNHLPEVSETKLARLVRRTDPFKDMERQVQDETAARRWLADREDDLKIPLPTEGRKAMPTEEPTVAAILRYVWPRGEHACRVLRTEIWRLHGRELDRLLRERVLTRRLVARLLHTTERRVASFVFAHFRSAGGRPLMGFRPRQTKPRRTKEDIALVAALGRTCLPGDPDARFAAIAARIDQHLPAVEDMIARGILSSPAAAKLLDIQAPEMPIVRAGRKAGLSAARALRNPRTEISDECWKGIDAEWAARRGREGRLEFCCRMVAEGFPGAVSTVYKRLIKLERKPVPEMTDEDRALVAALSGIAWSSHLETFRAQRNEVLVTHLAAVDVLIVAGKLGKLAAAALFRIKPERLAFLRSGLRAGLGPAAVVAGGGPIPEAVWTMVGREHALAREEPDLDFYWRMRLRHGFGGTLADMTNFREGLRLHQAALPPADAAAA